MEDYSYMYEMEDYSYMYEMEDYSYMYEMEDYGALELKVCRVPTQLSLASSFH